MRTHSTRRPKSNPALARYQEKRDFNSTAEPSGAVATAGALKVGGELGRSVAVLSGGNVDLDRLAAILCGD